MTTRDARERMLAGLPAARMLDIEGTATAVLELGEGPPLLLLHGGIECGGAMWAPVLRRLAQRHRVVVPDVPGLGESAPNRLDVDTFGRWLTGVVEQTGLDRPSLVAHSLVGSLAARLAATGGGPPLSQLVVYGAPAVGPYRTPWRLRYVAVRFGLRPTPRNAERFDRFALLDLDATRRLDPGWFDAFATYTRAQATKRHVKKTMVHLIAAQSKPMAAAELAAISVPTALLWGRHDRMVPLAVGEAASAAHGWPLHVVEGAAHAPHIEQPDRFVDALASILVAAA